MGIIDKIQDTLDEADKGRYECPNCHSTSVTSSLTGTTMHCDECGEDHPYSERVALHQRPEGWEKHDDEAKKLAANSMGDSVTRKTLLETIEHGSKDGETIISLLDADEEVHYILLGMSVDIQGGGDSNAITGNNRSRKDGTAGKVTTILTDKRIIVYIPQVFGNDQRNVPYDSINGVDIDIGTLQKRLTVQTYGRTYHFSGWYSEKEECREASEYLRIITE